MQLVRVFLLAPLIALWFVVVIAGALISWPVGIILKRLFGWDPHNTPDHQGHLELTVYCGLFFVAVCAGVGIFLLCRL
jgi:hypothetical protein